MQQKFELYIYHDQQKKQYKEKLKGLNKKTTDEMDLFGIANALFKVWPIKQFGNNYTIDEIFPKNIFDVLSKFTDQLFPTRWIDVQQEGEKPRYTYETPHEFKIFSVPRGDILRPSIYYGLERRLIETAIYEWLYPTGGGRSGSKTRWTPLKKYQTGITRDPFMFDAYLGLSRQINEATTTDKRELAKKNLEISLLEVQRARNLQYRTVLCNYEDVTKTVRTELETDEHINLKECVRKDTKLTKIPSKLFISNDGLLPLIWAEILYAVENNIYAKFCDNCDNLFAIPILKGQNGCSPGCCKALKIKNDKREQLREQLRQAKEGL